MLLFKVRSPAPTFVLRCRSSETLCETQRIESVCGGSATPLLRFEPSAKLRSRPAFRGKVGWLWASSDSATCDQVCVCLRLCEWVGGLSGNSRQWPRRLMGKNLEPALLVTHSTHAKGNTQSHIHLTTCCPICCALILIIGQTTNIRLYQTSCKISYINSFFLPYKRLWFTLQHNRWQYYCYD